MFEQSPVYLFGACLRMVRQYIDKELKNPLDELSLFGNLKMKYRAVPL